MGKSKGRAKQLNNMRTRPKGKRIRSLAASRATIAGKAGSRQDGQADQWRLPSRSTDRVRARREEMPGSWEPMQKGSRGRRRRKPMRCNGEESNRTNKAHRRSKAAMPPDAAVRMARGKARINAAQAAVSRCLCVLAQPGRASSWQSAPPGYMEK